MAVTWFSDHLTIYRGLHLRLAKAIGISLAIGLTSMDRKVSLMQLRHPFNSYNLMHNQDSYLRYKAKKNSRIVVRCIGACLARDRG
jgi:hypothetical protein